MIRFWDFKLTGAPAELARSAAEGLGVGSRMVALVVGVLTGAVVGALVTAAVCAALERYAGVEFRKEPLALIALVGMPVGAVVGGLLGLWSATPGGSRPEPAGLADPADRRGT